MSNIVIDGDVVALDPEPHYQSDEVHKVFELPASEMIVAQFDCAIYLYKVPTYGTMFVTQNHIAFKGSHMAYYEEKRVFSFGEIESFEKCKVLLANTGIQITVGNEKFLFHHFKKRDAAYNLLTHLWKYRLGGPYERFRHQTIKSIREMKAELAAREGERNRKQLLSSTGTGKKGKANNGNGNHPDDHLGDGFVKKQGRKGAKWDGSSDWDSFEEALYGKMDSGSESLQRSIRAAEQARQLGEDTLVRLDAQGEQIRQTKSMVDEISVNNYRSERILRGMTSFGGTLRNAFTNADARALHEKEEQDVLKQASKSFVYDESKAVDVLYTKNLAKLDYEAQAFMFASEYFERIDIEKKELLERIYYEGVKKFTLRERPFHFTITLFSTTKAQYIHMDCMSVRFVDIFYKMQNHLRREIDLDVSMAQFWSNKSKQQQQQEEKQQPHVGRARRTSSPSGSTTTTTTTKSDKDKLFEAPTPRSRKTTVAVDDDPSDLMSSSSSSSSGRYRSSNGGGGGGAGDRMSQVQAQIAYREKEQERDLDRLSHILGDLKQIGQSMNDTLVEQNRDLDELDDKMDRAHEHLKKNIRSIKNLL